jgi:hypothetical protein
MTRFRSTQLVLHAAVVVAVSGCSDGDPPFSLPPGYGDGLTGRAFRSGETNHTLADLQAVQLRLTFDVPAKTTVGHAEIQFQPVETGEPFFLLTPKATRATLDGQPITLDPLRDPDDVTTWTTIPARLVAGTDHVLEIDYPLAAAEYPSGGAELVTSMLDVLEDGRDGDPPHFFEAYGPAGIEADQFQLSVELDVVGGTSPQMVFSNGTQRAIGPGQWTIEFPAYFSSSSVFFHLTTAPYVVRTTTYHGLERDIPIAAYGVDADTAEQAIAVLPDLFADLEATFGPYPHAAFVADLPGHVDVSMEHAGAAITSLGSLSHELCHSWFGRGVLPADGRSGWIDEAVCTWRDFKYMDTLVHAQPSPINLAWYSMWYVATPGMPHADGAALVSHVDAMLAGRGGLRPILRQVFEQWQHKPITTEQFLGFLAAASGLSLDAYDQDHVYDGHPPPR